VEDGDTRSVSHPSTPAQHERMRVSSSKWWKRAGEGQANPGAHACMFVCTHRFFHTQTHTSRYCELCMYAYVKELRSANTFAGSVVKSLS
jgi:hypothetical protein